MFLYLTWIQDQKVFRASLWMTLNWEKQLIPSKVEKAYKEIWTITNCMKIIKRNCQTLHLGRGNFSYMYKLGAETLLSNSATREFGFLADSKLNMSLLCAQAGRPTISWDASRMALPSQSREVIGIVKTETLLRAWALQGNEIHFIWISCMCGCWWPESQRTLKAMEEKRHFSQ